MLNLHHALQLIQIVKLVFQDQMPVSSIQQLQMVQLQHHVHHTPVLQKHSDQHVSLFQVSTCQHIQFVF